MRCRIMTVEEILDDAKYKSVMIDVVEELEELPIDENEREIFLRGVSSAIFAVYGSDVAKPLLWCIDQLVEKGKITIYKL